VEAAASVIGAGEDNEVTGRSC